MEERQDEEEVVEVAVVDGRAIGGVQRKRTYVVMLRVKLAVDVAVVTINEEEDTPESVEEASTKKPAHALPEPEQTHDEG